MKKSFVSIVSFVALSTTLVACGGSGAKEKRAAHKDEAIYTATLDGTKKENLTWAQSYDEVIKRTKTTTGTQRESYLHQAEDILMETGAICPLYYYTDIYMKDPKLTGFYSSPLGYKFFQKAKWDGKTEFNVCVGPAADTFDPALNSAVDGAIVISHVFEGLYRWKAPTAPNVSTTELEEGQAAKAEKSEVAANGHVTWTITLKDGLTFSDGTELKASDFANSWARAASGKLAADYSYMFDCIVGFEETNADTTQYKPLSGVQADDDKKEIKVELVSDIPYFKELLAFPTYMPVKIPQKDGKEDASWWTKPESYIGNGPMKMESLNNTEGGKLVLVKNDKYWDNANVTATKINFQLTKSDDAQLTNFKVSTDAAWQFIDSVPNAQIPDLKKDTTTYGVLPQLGTYYICFNVNDDTLNGFLHSEKEYAKFRKALGLLIDRNYICEEIGQADQVPASTFVSKGITVKDDNGKDNEWLANANKKDGEGYYSVKKADYQKNVDQAITDIKSLGFKYDEKTKKFTNIPTIQYLVNDGSGHIAIGEYLQQAFKSVGIKLEIKQQEWAVFLNTRNAGEFSLARNGWLADYNDPCSYLDMWITNSGNNDAQFGR